MLVAALLPAWIGLAAEMAGFAGGDGEVDSEMAERGQSGRGEVTELLEAAPGAIVDKEAVGGVDIRGEFGVDCAVGLKQGACSSERCCKSV